VNKPFISFYGGDVAVGGDFANVASCDSPSSGVGITASLNSSNLGAGVEFAAMATGSIQGFRTAKATPTAPINKLGFANTSSHFGNFGSATCIKDYFASFTSISPSNMTDITSDTSIDIDTKSSGSYGYNVSSGHTLSLKGTLDLSQRVALYINGDLVIDNEISADSSWTTIEQIPSLHVYVKGNIYIQPNVKEMTGLFVAQPSSPTDTDGGKIITCSNGKSAVANNAIYNTCNNKLLVKGSLVAKKIDFLRAKGSLRDANIKGEQDASTSAAAEVIELTPEILMVAPDDITNANASRYQYFTVLPPVL
ncbi:hypothetical protein KDA11_01025, partial [Candidatus Saccharibacteria bacterium]|nr:hypothetical protein [Candidatus Saccharibacteria bacterium]